jgi:hypothetical protein
MPLCSGRIGAVEQPVLSLVVDADIFDELAVIPDLGQASARVSGCCLSAARRQLFSVLGEDADGVAPVEAVADRTSGGRVGGEVGVVVFDRSRRVAELF